MSNHKILWAGLVCVIVLPVMYVIYDFNRTVSSEGMGEKMHVTDRCFRSATIETGTTAGPWYRTVAPCEAFDSERTHTFPDTCAVNEIIKSGNIKIKARTIGGLPGIYNVVTRNRDELFVLGGSTQSTDYCDDDGAKCATGPFVAKLDAYTLKILWRTQISNAKVNGDWDYPGAIGVHGNGFVYVVGGYTLAKLDPQSGRIVRKIKLPTPESRKSGDTAYNGFSILSDGSLVVKSLTRQKDSSADSIRALLFHFDENVPSILSVIQPENLKLVASLKVKEPVLGRITTGIFNKMEYIYVAGFKNLIRYIYHNKSLKLDTDWGPVLYCLEGQKPATAPAFFGEYVLVQTNFQLAKGLISLTAVSHADDSKVFRITPFADDRILPGSLQWSLPTVDLANKRIYTYDFLEGRLAAVDFHPEKGFTMAWKNDQRSLSFGTIMGTKDNRTFVLEDSNFPSLTTVKVVWRDAETGKELARSPAIRQGIGLPITPGFDGVIYYPSHDGSLTELSLSH